MSVIYRQGPLTVERDGDAFRVVDDAGTALVSAAGDIHVEGCDEVVGVVAAALSSRITAASFHVHAGAVRTAAGVILVAGDSGAGKTTASLALGTVGAVVGDDVCFVRVVDDAVVAQAWSKPLHVGAVTQAMFPTLEILGGDRTRAGKHRARLPAVGDGAGHGWWPVQAIVLPAIDRREDARTHASRSPATSTLGRLLQASAMVTWAGVPHGQAHLDVLGRLARCPGFMLVMGADARRDPAVVVDVLRRAGLDI